MPDLLDIISVVVIIAAFPLIAVITAMVTHERQREIGLLRSMGAKRKVIILLVMAESLSLAVMGGVAGVGASLIAFTVFGNLPVLSSVYQNLAPHAGGCRYRYNGWCGVVFCNCNQYDILDVSGIQEQQDESLRSNPE